MDHNYIRIVFVGRYTSALQLIVYRYIIITLLLYTDDATELNVENEILAE